HQGRGAPCGESFWHWALGADGGHGHAQPPFRSSRLIGAERQPTSDCRQSCNRAFASMQGDSEERASTEMLEWVHDGLESVVAADVDDSHAVPVGAARLGVAFCAADVTEPVLVAPPDRDLDIVGDL